MNRHRPLPSGLPVTSWRLLLLAGMVLAAHLLLLGGLQLDGLATAPASTLNRPLVTRTVAPPAPPPETRPPPARPRPARPRPAAPPVPPPEPATTSDTAPVASAPTAIEPVANDAVATPPETAASAPAAASATAPAEAPLPAASVPGSLRLDYQLYGEVRALPYTADAELLWAHDGTAYEAQLEISAFLLGSRRQTSRGLLTPQGLRPKRFGDKVRSEVAAHFEYDKGKVIFSANTPEAPLQPGAQDQLSIFIQLASLLAAEPQRYPRGSAIELQAVGARESDSWRFVVDGEERLNLPGGEQATVRLTRAPRQPHELTVGLWLAPALGYLPVRIKLTQDNGDFVDMQWRSSAPP